MAQSHVILALVKKRADLSGQLNALNKPRRELTNQIAQVDQVLTMMGYDSDPKDIKPRRKNVRSLFKRKMLRRMLYDIHRELPGMIATQDIAAEVMRRLGWDLGDAALRFSVFLKVRDVRKAIGW